jgi:hypothetical protein
MGKQVYISDQHHRKLKAVASIRDRKMKDMVEEFVESLDFDDIDSLPNE